MNKKISNVDSLSALLDRLITERIKHYFFEKEGSLDKVSHQDSVISELKNRISVTLSECLLEHDYDVVLEKRTFNLSDVVGEIDSLTISDIQVGENDRLALSGLQLNDFDLMSEGISKFRKANECRSKSKNLIDILFQKLFKQ